jgi:hypothetical protein
MPDLARRLALLSGAGGGGGGTRIVRVGFAPAAAFPVFRKAQSLVPLTARSAAAATTALVGKSSFSAAVPAEWTPIYGGPD